MPSLPYTGSPRLRTQRNLLSNPDTFATTLLVILIDTYGTEALEWAPETTRMELEDDYNVKLPRNNLDKIMAAVTVLTTDLFLKDLPSFIRLCNIFAGDAFDPSVFDIATSREMAWAITEAVLLYPPEEDEPFSEEIRQYIGKITQLEGLLSLPDVLAIGIKPDDVGDPLGGMADDPEMYQAYYELKDSQQKDISAVIQENLRELLSEIESIGLSQGDSKDLLQRLRGNVAS